MKKTLTVVLATLTLTVCFLASRPGKGIIATSVVSVLRAETHQTLRRFEMASANQAPGLLVAARHQATRLQQSIQDLQDTDMSTWDADDRTDFASFLVTLEPSMEDLYEEAVFLGDTDLQQSFQSSQQDLNTVIGNLKVIDPDFGTIYDNISQQ